MQTNQNQPVLFTESHPILNVKDVAASLEYYCDTLGYKLKFRWPYQCPDPGAAVVVPEFAEVKRGQSSIMLALENQGGPAMWIYLDVASLEDLTALYQEYQANGARIVEPPTDKPWNMREMLVEDLDGHTLRIGASISQ